jgi:hypothetical protein
MPPDTFPAEAGYPWMMDLGAWYEQRRLSKYYETVPKVHVLHRCVRKGFVESM